MPTSTESLERLAAGRTESLFVPDMAARAAEIEKAVRGAPVLVVGGAGSIGAAMARLIATYRPSHLHVVDQDENGLVELVRDMRSNGLAARVGHLRALALDYGSPVMRHFLSDAPPYRLVLNFAAIKHVRSEKDLPSILHMLDTNVVKPRRFMDWLAERRFGGSYYAVSTDKAADPVNFMGASKRVQEALTLRVGALAGSRVHTSCARFANVAFSNGSLLYGFLRRLELGQALAVPRGVTRYFISHQEAAEICVLAAVVAPSGHVVVPRPGGSLVPVDLTTVAVAVLQQRGLEPQFCSSEDEARKRASHPAPGTYPVLLTEPDTAGEKLTELFVGDEEEAVEIGMNRLMGIRPRSDGDDQALAFAAEVEALIASDRPFTIADLEARMAAALPAFRHAASGKTLDDRM